MLLDSGASCSVVLASYACQSEIKPIASTKLLSADGRHIIPQGFITMTVTLEDFSVEQSFIVVECLSTPVILGCDYLTDNGFVLRFKQGTFHRAENPDQLKPYFATLSLLTVIPHKQFQPDVRTVAQVTVPVMFILTWYPYLKTLKPSFHSRLVKLMLLSDIEDALPIKIPPLSLCRQGACSVGRHSKRRYNPQVLVCDVHQQITYPRIQERLEIVLTLSSPIK